MPFFYSQYLTNDKSKGNRGNASNERRLPSRTGSERRPGITRQRSLTRRPASLVWHSGTGASGRSSIAHNNYNPLKNKAGGKKVVHFSTIEVQPFNFDWNLANDIFYTRAELTAMGQSRFDDAATLRQQRHTGKKGANTSLDDVGISTKSKAEEIANLLAMALDDEDRDDSVSIRGIEHFVYPGLQQEMIRRKKEVQKEVLGFVRSKRPDPQGWRLAEHSRSFSQWARNVSMEKGMKYCMNNAAVDPESGISQEQLERFQKSQDDLDNSSRSIRGSASFPAKGSASFDADNTAKRGVLHEIAEDKKPGDDPDESHESQPAGSDTRED